jgi:hypothetical protein
MDEMTAVAGAVRPLSEAARRRVAAAEALRRASARDFDRGAAEARFDALLGGEA